MATTSNFGWTTPDDTDLVRDGAAAIRTLGNAIDATVGGGYLYAGTRYYTSSGTFAKADPLGTGDIGLRAVRVRMVGGGGGGGRPSSGRSGGGGGAGAYTESFLLASGLSASETVTRGAGGNGATASAPANGTSGGQSSFAGVTAPGGLTTLVDGVEYGPGGAAGSGDFSVAGGDGGPGQVDSTSVTFATGHGGSSFFGGGLNVQQARSAQVRDAENARAFGAGGGGGLSTGTGGDGADGVVIIDCYV